MKKYKINEATMCCAVCGGLNVERKVWADVNTDEVLDEVSWMDEDTWCRDCEEHTGLMLLSEWKEQTEEEGYDLE